MHVTIAYGTRQPCDEALLQVRARRPCPQRDKPWVLATAILGSSLTFIEGTAVNLALPGIQAELGTTSAGIQWVANAYLLVLGSLMLTGGALGDRYGLRRIFIIGTVVFGAGALACAFARSAPLLIVARSIQGAGGALLVPNSLALVSSHFAERERGKAIGTWAGASALTTAAGPLIGGWLVDRWGWPAVFFLVVPLAALTAAMAWRRVPVSDVSRHEKLDYVGALLLAAALALLVYALVDSGDALRRWLMVVVATVFAAAFIRREARFAAPMLPLRLFRSRAFSGANLTTLLLYGALGGALYFLPFNLIQVQGYSAFEAGAAFLPFTLILGFGSTFAGDLIRRFEPRAILTMGPLVTALGFVTLAMPVHGSSYVAAFLPGIVVIGIGMTLTVAPLTTVVMSSVGQSQAGVASGANNTAARLAGVLALAGLTAIAVAHFAGDLEQRLQDRGVAPELVQRLRADASRLAELKPPPGAAPAAAAVTEAAVVAAYVDTFRFLMLICAALAAAGGLVAWISLARGAGARSAHLKP